MNSEKVPAIILFIKFPTVGFVKTRLISEIITETQACNLQIEMIKDTLLILASIKETDFQPIISFYPPENAEDIKFLIKSFSNIVPKAFLERFVYIPQFGDSIGDHFSSTFNQAFQIANINSCLIIAGDTPHLHVSIIYQSLKSLQLNKRSAIIGPSQMGGFYIFGLTENISGLNNIFSKPNEFKNIIELCNSLNYKTKILAYNFDIDTFQDVQSLYYIFESMNGNKNADLNRPVHTMNYLLKLFSEKKAK